MNELEKKKKRLNHASLYLNLTILNCLESSSTRFLLKGIQE